MEKFGAEAKAADLSITCPTQAKPFLKWAGGKSQLLDKFQDLYPEELKRNKISTYVEPFLGSGAVFFDIVQRYPIQQAFLFDVNEELILTYRVIQQDVVKLVEKLWDYQRKYSRLKKEKRTEFYYRQRAGYNKQRYRLDYRTYSEKWVSRAALLIFLNRTCYNGLYRVNSRGEFNSPAGAYDNPTICDEKNLLAVHQALQVAEIRCADFREAGQAVSNNSFVYFDPPYRPISKTSAFKAYSSNGFSDKDQMDLANLFKRLDKLGAKAMLSNSDPRNVDPRDDFFDNLFDGYHIVRVPAKRLINSNPSGRGMINEIVVTNYSIVKDHRKEELCKGQTIEAIV